MKLFRLISLLFVLTFIYSCGTEKVDLKGTWRVADVETDFTISSMTPDMISQVVEMQKQTHFRILDDTTLIILSNTNTYQGVWNYSPEDSIIRFFFDNNIDKVNELGKLVDNTIVSKSVSQVGSITVTYAKTKE